MLQGKHNYYLIAIFTSWVVLILHISIQVILTPLYLNTFGEYEFGVLGLIMASLNIIGAGVGWIIGPFNRLLNKNNNKKRLEKIFIVGKLAFLIYIIAVITTVTLVLLVLRYFEIERFMIDINLIISFFILLIFTYYSIPEKLLLNQIGRQVTGNIIEIFKILVYFTLVSLILSKNSSLSTILNCLSVSVIIQIVMTEINLRKLNLKLISRIKELKIYTVILIKENSKYYGIFSMLSVFNQADILLIGYIGGGTEAGKYILLWKIPELLISILNRIPSTLEPKIIEYSLKGNHNQLKLVYKKYLKYYYLICISVCLIYIISILELTKLWVGKYAVNDQFIYNIIGIVIFIISINKWNISFLIGIGKIRDLTNINIFEIILKYLLIIVLYKHYDLFGAIYANLIVSILFYFYYQKALFYKNV